MFLLKAENVLNVTVFSPLNAKPPPPLFWNIFFVPLLALLALPWQLCLNIINIFKMPEKKKVGGVENTRKIVEKNDNPNFFHRGLFGSTFISKLKESIYKACLCSKWVGRFPNPEDFKIEFTFASVLPGVFLNVKVRYWTCSRTELERYWKDECKIEIMDMVEQIK